MKLVRKEPMKTFSSFYFEVLLCEFFVYDVVLDEECRQGVMVVPMRR